MNTLKHIRKNVFQVTQSEFAALAGVVQSSVSRWENGIPPTLDELRLIRRAAAGKKIRWSDSWFFEVPESKTRKSSVTSSGEVAA